MKKQFDRLTLLCTVLLLSAAFGSAQCLVPEDEIFSGGPGRDGIPALTNPKVVSATAADAFLLPEDLVLGVEINGEARAYPHAVLWWHEIVNDVVGGMPIAVSFCPLTGSGLVYDPVVLGEGTEPVNFGVSGLLFDNNLILFDRTSDTLWSQMRVQGICGPATGTFPRQLPVVQSTWAGWRALYPGTTVVNFETGFSRNYDRYPYGDYDVVGNNDLLFPHSFIDSRLPMKQVVLGISHEGVHRAYSHATMKAERAQLVVNDDVNGRKVLVVFDNDRQLAIPFDRTLRLTETESRVLSFDIAEPGGFPYMLRDRESGSLWTMTGQALEGELAGTALSRIPTFSAMWFAWASFNQGTEIWEP